MDYQRNKLLKRNYDWSDFNFSDLLALVDILSPMMIGGSIIGIFLGVVAAPFMLSANLTNLRMNHRATPESQGKPFLTKIGAVLRFLPILVFLGLLDASVGKPKISLGIDYLTETEFKVLSGKKVGLLTHPAAKTDGDKARWKCCLHLRSRFGCLVRP